MKTIIILIELLASMVAWTLFGLLLSTGIAWSWNGIVPHVGGPHIDVFIGFIGYLVIFGLWLLFVVPLKEAKKTKKSEEQ